MTLDQQLTDIIAAARRQLMAQFDERTRRLVAEVDEAASSEWAAAIHELQLAAEAEIVRRTQEAVAAAEADAAGRAAAAVAASQADLARHVEDARSAERAEADARLAAAAAESQADLARHVEEARSAERAEADQRVAAAVADARRETDETARQTATQALVESQVAARQSELAQIDRVVEAVRRFDQARSLTEVLDALGDVTSREAPRVALFLVRGKRLAGWLATGFGSAVDPHALDVANDESSLLWRAIATGQSLSTTDAAPGDRLTTPFGELGPAAAGLAVPVRVGGEAVAVIYADDAAEGPRKVPSAWPEVLEVMARHAARCLEVLTMSRGVALAMTALGQTAGSPATPNERAAVSTPRAEDDESARRYARLLVSEIKLYHEAAVAEGRHAHNLADRLRSEIDRARKLYEERVPVDIRSRTDHFGQELVRTLADGDPALLGTSST